MRRSRTISISAPSPATPTPQPLPTRGRGEEAHPLFNAILGPRESACGDRSPSIRRAQLSHVLVRRQHRGAVDVLEIDHDGLAVLERELAHIGPHGGLMVAAAIHERTERAVDLEAVE